MSKPPTKAEKAHMDKVAALGCIMPYLSQSACCQGPLTLHHSRTRPDGQNYGMSQRAPHTEVIPLCQWHHKTGPITEAIHAGPRAWEHRWGWTERQILEYVQTLLESRP